MPVYFLVGSAGLYLWWIIYAQLLPVASYPTYGLLKLRQGSHVGETVAFFIYETPKVLMLLTLVVFAMWNMGVAFLVGVILDNSIRKGWIKI